MVFPLKKLKQNRRQIQISKLLIPCANIYIQSKINGGLFTLQAESVKATNRI